MGEAGDEALSLVVVIMAITDMPRNIATLLKNKKMAIMLFGMIWNASHAIVASQATYFNLLGIEVPPQVEAAVNIVSILLAVLSVVSGALALLDWCRAQPDDAEATDQVYSKLTSIESSSPASQLTAWREPSRSISQDSALSITMMMEQLTL